MTSGHGASVSSVSAEEFVQARAVSLAAGTGGNIGGDGGAPHSSVIVWFESQVNVYVVPVLRGHVAGVSAVLQD